MTRKLRSTILYLGIVAVLVALLLEGATRLLLPPIEVPTVPRAVGRYDPALGWSLEPGATATSSRTGYPIEYRINSRGLRDNETSYAKPPDTFRIVVIGDSRTFGFGVPIEKHFTRLLEGYFTEVEVINLGVSGFGVDQEFLRLRSEGFRYQPDLVVAYVAHYSSHRHMYGYLWGKHKPRFELVDGELVLHQMPVRTIAADPPKLLLRVHQWLRQQSRAYAALRDAVAAVLSNKNTTTAKPAAGQQPDDEGKDAAFIERSNVLAEAIIGAMNKESAAHGAEFLVITPLPRLNASNQAAGIRSLDIKRPLHNPLYALPDKLKHINEPGNGVMAWEIADYLMRNRLIPEKHLRK